VTLGLENDFSILALPELPLLIGVFFHLILVLLHNTLHSHFTVVLGCYLLAEVTALTAHDFSLAVLFALELVFRAGTEIVV